MNYALLPYPLVLLTLDPDPQGPDGQAQLVEGEDAVLILVIQQKQLLIVSYLQRAQVVLTLKTMQKTSCSFFLSFPYFLLTRSMCTISSTLSGLPPLPFTFFTVFTPFRH